MLFTEGPSYVYLLKTAYIETVLD